MTDWDQVDARLTALLRANQAVGSSLDLTHVLEEIVRQAAAISAAPIVRLFLLEEETQLLRGRVSVGFPLDVEGGLAIPVEGTFSGQVAATGEPLAVADTRGDPRTYYPTHVDKYGVVSYLGLPVKRQGRPFGVLVFNTPTPRTYATEEITYLRAFSDQAAIAIENARLFEEERLRRTQLETVRAITAEITRELDLPTVLRLITQRACELTGAGGGDLYLWNPDTDTLLPEAAYGQAVGRPKGPRRLGEGVLGTVAQRREGVIVNDYRRSPWAHPRTLAATGITAVLTEPLLYGDRLLGVIGVDHSGEGRAFTAQDQATLQLFAAQAAIAIENARLFAALNDSYAHLQAAQAEMIRTEKLRALGQLAAGIAHDLNNMLAAILGQAEILRLRVQPPEVEEALQVLDTAASDGVQVVRRLLEFGRPHPTRPLVLCDLASLVAEALELTRPRWQDEAQRQNRHIQVQTALDGLPQVSGDPAELREALTNLILNAVDAMPAGGTLTVAGYPDPTPALPGDPPTVVLTVADTGAGMPEEVRRHLFEPFFTTKGVRGTGLGLALVYGVLERHRGRIEVASSPGHGTTFTLRFPIAQDAPAGTPEVDRALARPVLRLLLVDDEESVRTTMACLLRAVGHEVVDVGSGAEALTRLAEAPVDLVITDLGMPEMTGWEVAQRVKAAQPHLPVILLTGWGQQATSSAPGQECVDRVLAKPIRLEELQDAIAQVAIGPPDPRSGVRE